MISRILRPLTCLLCYDNISNAVCLKVWCPTLGNGTSIQSSAAYCELWLPLLTLTVTNRSWLSVLLFIKHFFLLCHESCCYVSDPHHCVTTYVLCNMLLILWRSYKHLHSLMAKDVEHPISHLYFFSQRTLFSSNANLEDGLLLYLMFSFFLVLCLL